MDTLQEFINQYGPTAAKFYLQEISRSLLPEERIRVCWRYPLPSTSAIDIIYSEEMGRARSAGLMKCGSGWVCPACQGYIAERRRQELQKAIDDTRESMVVVMATFTVQHGRKDQLSALIEKMMEAYRQMKSGRHWQAIKNHYQMVGSVRALEVTHGAHGWHPHYHELIFMSKDVLSDNNAGCLDELERSLKGDVGGRWFECLATKGLYSDIEQAFDVRTASARIGEYVAKFGKMPRAGVSVDAAEMTGRNTKICREGNYSINELLFRAASDKQARGLFVEYAKATKGRSQLQWSRGLKDLLNIEIIRDEIAAQGIETQTDRILASIDFDTWRNLAGMGLLPQLMTIANLGDENKVNWLLERVREKMSQSNATIDWQLGH